MGELLMTPTGVLRSRGELESLYAQREALLVRIKIAVDHSRDLASNGEYLDARREQELLERRIGQLEQRLDVAEIVAATPPDGKVDVGERVRVRDLETGDAIDFQIVGVAESNPAVGAISYQSPIGAALLGRRRGDVVVVEAPKCLLTFEVVAVHG